MDIQPPFMYDSVQSTTGFDPKAVSRASLTPAPSRAKQEGPLISFNQHPDSYLIHPYSRNKGESMSPSTKLWIKWFRIFQLVLRIVECLDAVGQLVFMILIRVHGSTGWVMKIVPGVAILHTIYGAYHLSRKASGRTPASSASYMIFAALLDVSIISFYTYGALETWSSEHSASSTWTTILSNKSLISEFSKIEFYLASAGSGLHLFSFFISIYLAVMFRKITKLPPDMNPLEDNLTSRHKRNRSSVSTLTSFAEKRISVPFESNQRSGAAYEELSRPPTVPFMHTRTGSSDSFSTFKSTTGSSRDSRLDLPSRQYQVTTSGPKKSSGNLKRSSGRATPTAPSKKASYVEVPLSETSSRRDSVRLTTDAGEWYTSDTPTKSRIRNGSPKKGRYEILPQPYDSTEGTYDHPSPLRANPPLQENDYQSKRQNVLPNIRSNHQIDTKISSPDDLPKAKRYGDLNPGPPVTVSRSSTRQVSSGNDYSQFKGERRDVSGKIVEEGRAGKGNWGTRFRKVSGL